MKKIEIGKKYQVSGAVLKKLLRDANIETLRQIELAHISLVDSDCISNVSILSFIEWYNEKYMNASDDPIERGHIVEFMSEC